MPLSGITAMPFASGAADAAVANSAEAPSASEIIVLFILNSCELNSCQPMVETTNCSSIQPSIGSLADGTDSFGASINQDNLLVRPTFGLATQTGDERHEDNGDERHEENFDYCRRCDADWIIGLQLCWFIGHEG